MTAGYIALTPWVVVHTPTGIFLGASDLLLLFAIVALLREPAPRRIGASWLLVLFIASAYVSTVAVISATGKADFEQVLTLTRAVAVLVPFLVAIAHGPFTIRELKLLLNLLLVSGITAMSTGLVMNQLGIQVRDAQQTIWLSAGDSVLRAGGLLGNSSSFGSLSAVIAVSAIGLAVVTKTRRNWTTLLVVLSVLAIIAASSRASLLNVVVVLLVLMPLLLRGRPLLAISLVAGVAIGVLALGTLAVQVSPSTATGAALSRLDFLNLSGYSTFYQSSTRLNSWQTMLTIFQQHYVWGTGYNTTVSIVGNAGDNTYFSVFVELGIFTGALFVLYWVVTGATLLTAANRSVRWVGIAIWIGEFVQMFTVDAYREWSSTPILMAVLGVLCASRAHGEAQPSMRNRLDEHRPTGGWQRVGH